MTSLNRMMAKGAAWMLLMKLADRGIGLFSVVILARLLVPADFGLVTLANAIIAVLALLGAFGFDTALIQNQNAARAHFDTAWTLAVGFGTLCAGVLLLLAYPAAALYGEPRLAPVMQVLALSTFIAGFENVGMVIYRKDLRFDWEFRFLFTKRCAVFAVTVTLAYYLRNYWALVAGIVCGSVVSVAASYAWHPYRPRLSLVAFRELFGFSRWLLLSNALGFLYHRSADFIIAKAAGPGALGQYSVAYEIANLPSAEMAMPINRAVFSGYAKMSDDPDALRTGLLSVLALLGLVAIPAGAGLACVAGSVVRVALGEQWVGAIPVIQILALNGVLTAITTCCNYAYLALGKPRYGTTIVGVSVALSIPLVTYAIFTRDIVAVAWVILGVSLLLLPLNYFFLATVLGIRIRDLVRTFWRPVVATAIMAWAVTAAAPLADFGTGTAERLAGLLVQVGIGVLVYGVVIVALWSALRFPAGPERHLYELVVARWQARRRAAASDSSASP